MAESKVCIYSSKYFFCKGIYCRFVKKKIFGNQSWSGAVLEVNWKFLSADSHATEIGMKTMPSWWLVTSSNSRLTLHYFFSVERDNLSNVQESRTTLMKYSLYWEPPSTLSISLITHPHKKKKKNKLLHVCIMKPAEHSLNNGSGGSF